MTPDLDRIEAALFWPHVDSSRGAGFCWPWIGQRTDRGYGVVERGSKRRGDRMRARAHRVAWHLTNGPIPDELDVLHRCDNPPCCNPAHLFIGTDADNSADMVEKGRQLAGARNPRAKITPVEVAAIRSSPLSQTALAHLYGLGQSQVGRIRRGERWSEAGAGAIHEYAGGRGGGA